MAKSPPKPVVFISHITEEKEIAIAFKTLIEQGFLGLMEVFVASAPSGLDLGRQWLAQITTKLKQCVIEVVIASPKSVKRPWINFEAGAGWVRDIPVIPLCHSGMTPATLPQPLASLQSVSASQEDDLKRTVETLARVLNGNVPELDYGPFIELVRQYAIDSAEIEKLNDESVVVPIAGLSPIELVSLHAILEMSDGTSGTCFVQQVRNQVDQAGMKPSAAILGVKMLERKGLVVITEEFDPYHEQSYPTVSLTEDGWNWIQSNHNVFDFNKSRPMQEDLPW